MAYALSLVGRALVTASTESSRTSNLADVCRHRPDGGLGHAGEMSVEMRWRAAFGIVGNIIAAIYDGSAVSRSALFGRLSLAPGSEKCVVKCGAFT